MNIKVQTQQTNKVDIKEYSWDPKDLPEKPTVLDALVYCQERLDSMLSFRYGCRSGNCGVCTVEVNGRPRLACLTKVKVNDIVAPLQGFPIIRDLIIKRDQVNRQIAGKISMLKLAAKRQNTPAMVRLNKCIECYACISKCALHRQNSDYNKPSYGNPYVFLKLAQLALHPDCPKELREETLQFGRTLGLESYDLRKTPGCSVGINLKKEVLEPLMTLAAEKKE